MTFRPAIMTPERLTELSALWRVLPRFLPYFCRSVVLELVDGALVKDDEIADMRHALQSADDLLRHAWHAARLQGDNRLAILIKKWRTDAVNMRGPRRARMG